MPVFNLTIDTDAKTLVASMDGGVVPAIEASVYRHEYKNYEGENNVCLQFSLTEVERSKGEVKALRHSYSFDGVMSAEASAKYEKSEGDSVLASVDKRLISEFLNKQLNK